MALLLLSSPKKQLCTSSYLDGQQTEGGVGRIANRQILPPPPPQLPHPPIQFRLRSRNNVICGCFSENFCRHYGRDILYSFLVLPSSPLIYFTVFRRCRSVLKRRLRPVFLPLKAVLLRKLLQTSFLLTTPPIP